MLKARGENTINVWKIIVVIMMGWIEVNLWMDLWIFMDILKKQQQINTHTRICFSGKYDKKNTNWHIKICFEVRQ